MFFSSDYYSRVSLTQLSDADGFQGIFRQTCVLLIPGTAILFLHFVHSWERSNINRNSKISR